MKVVYLLSPDEVLEAIKLYASSQGLGVEGDNFTIEMQADGSIQLSNGAMTPAPIATTAPEVLKDLNPVKKVEPANLTAWDRGSWVNLRSSGFRKHVEANLSSFENCDAETQKAVTAKWGTLYEEEPFPSWELVVDPIAEENAAALGEDPEPDPDATGEREPVDQAGTVGDLMEGEQKTDDTTLPPELETTEENEESLFG